MAAIETGAPIWIYNGPQTDYVALNQPGDSKFVGYCTDISGIDDAGVRENAQVVVAGDGGHHGPFWRDRRPFTVSGIILPTLPVLTRDIAQERLEYIVGQAMKTEGYFTWLPADGIYKTLPFRKQQPVRISKGQSNIEKTFQLSLVTADYRVKSFHDTTLSAAGPAPSMTVTGVGNADAPALYTVTGPCGRFSIQNTLTSKQILINSILASGDTIIVDTKPEYPVVSHGGANIYGAVDPLNTDWSIAVSPGIQTFALVDVTGGVFTSTTALSVEWFDAWL